MASYPIHCNGQVFERGTDFHDWIDDLHSKSSLSPSERSAVEYTYDNGYLAHWDYKQLRKKPTAGATHE
jgi:hypothetical protein